MCACACCVWGVVCLLSMQVVRAMLVERDTFTRSKKNLPSYFDRPFNKISGLHRGMSWYNLVRGNTTRWFQAGQRLIIFDCQFHWDRSQFHGKKAKGWIARAKLKHSKWPGTIAWPRAVYNPIFKLSRLCSCVLYAYRALACHIYILYTNLVYIFQLSVLFPTPPTSHFILLSINDRSLAVFLYSSYPWQ